jgi:His/Glu/Gln/Arg/opine family amino acid ABC transporter permease subunit
LAAQSLGNPNAGDDRGFHVTVQQLLIFLIFGLPVSPEMADPRFPIFLQNLGGLLLTLLITVFSLSIGAVLGTLLALGRRGSTVPHGHLLKNLFIRGYGYIAAGTVEGIRGLPIMLLVLLIFYVPYRVIDVRIPSFVLAIITFSLYAGVYFSEILRAGFRSIDPELRQVARVLGLTSRQILFKIELPIVYRTMMPDLINLSVTVFKDTSTLAIVAVPELTYVARQMLMSEPMRYELSLFIVLVLYWLPATVLSAFAFRAEHRPANLRVYA